MIKLHEEEPSFANKHGKFWYMKPTTEYAQKPDKHGTSLENINVYKVESVKGGTFFVMFDNGVPIYETKQLEAMAVRIDAMKLNERME